MRHPLPLHRLPSLADDGGLDDEEARARLQTYGPNTILEDAEAPWLRIATDTARDPMIWFLVGSAALYAVLGSYREAVTLLAAIAPLIAMDALLHRRTIASTRGLSELLAAHATVVRSGRERSVPAVELVPGDLVRVVSGESFPADGVLVGGAGLQVDESSLTGESFPVRKQVVRGPPRDGAEPAVDAACWGFAGTRLLTGRAAVRIAHTAGETLYGQIVRTATRSTSERTPLQVAIGGLVATLLIVAVALCAALAFVRLRQGQGWVDALVSAATLAVAALPEEFPVVFTVFLGVGVYRLAKRRALVRRAVCVENIGRVSVICSDKTGTITEGRLRLQHLLPAGNTAPAELLRWAALASRRDSGDPLDRAILERADADGVATEGDIVMAFPFTEDRRVETSVARVAGELVAAAKGTPEVILARTELPEAERAAWLDRVRALGDEAHKVIACATRPLSEAWVGGEPDRGFRFVGLLACEDPVRDGVADAVAACHRAHIRVLLVTGDHPATAAAVAREVGLGGREPRVVTGAELDDLCRARGGACPPDVDVIARALPGHKLTAVRALRGAGEVVAVTGDGVNDVPALQAADIGIAMGERGTRSARDVAAMVLLDDNFRTIVQAIAEGRQLFRNLQRSFQYLLMIHVPLVATATVIPFAGYPLLYLPIHILWMEAIIHPTAMLAFQAPSPGALDAAPPRRSSKFFSALDWGAVLATGLLATLLVAATYDRGLGAHRDVEHARAMSLVALSLVGASMTIALSRLRTRAARWLTVATVLSAVVLVQIAPLASALHMSPLHLDDWLLAAAGATATVGVPRLAAWAVHVAAR